MSRISDLHNQRSQILADLTSLTLSGIKTAEEKEEYRKLSEQESLISSDINVLEKIERYLAANPSAPAATRGVTIPTTAEQRAEHREKLNEAFRCYLRNGELRDIITTSGGAALISQETFPVIGEVQKYYAPLLKYVSLEEMTAGRHTQFVTEDDTANALTVQTESNASSESDPTYSDVILDHDLLSSVIKYSIQLLEDSRKFDLTQLIVKAAGRRLGRSFDSLIINGKDPANNSAPHNIGGNGLAGTVTVGTTTSALADGIGWADLIEGLVESVDPAYLGSPSTAFVMSYGTMIYLMSQKDGAGRRFYDELINEQRIGHWPVVISNALPQTFAANNIQVLFGDLSSVGVSYSTSLLFLRERFADQLKQGAVLAARVASTLLVPNAIKSLKLGS